VSGESAALYFGRLFAIELLQPQFCVRVRSIMRQPSWGSGGPGGRGAQGRPAGLIRRWTRGTPELLVLFGQGRKRTNTNAPLLTGICKTPGKHDCESPGT